MSTVRVVDGIRPFGLWAVLVVGALHCAAVGAATSTPDVGMIIRLSGEVVFWSANTEGAPAKVETFMKVREGDRFRLSQNALVQVVYFSNGRKETWKGPVTFRTGSLEGQAEGNAGAKGKPRVVSLPNPVARQVRRVAVLVDPSRLHRSGASQVRAGVTERSRKPLEPLSLTPQEKKELEAARETYESMLKQVDPDDITPELYLFSVLADYDRFEDMRILTGRMREKQPDNAGIDRLEAWLKDHE